MLFTAGDPPTRVPCRFRLGCLFLLIVSVPFSFLNFLLVLLIQLLDTEAAESGKLRDAPPNATTTRRENDFEGEGKKARRRK